MYDEGREKLEKGQTIVKNSHGQDEIRERKKTGEKERERDRGHNKNGIVNLPITQLAENKCPNDITDVRGCVRISLI